MRLVTRGDLDGLVSAVLIATMEQIDGLELIHPQDITDDRFPVREGDILANLPFHPAASMWFDHHELTASNRRPPAEFPGAHALKPSVARVVFDHYRSDRLRRFEPLVSEADRFDSAQLTIDDVSDPRGAILLGFTIDPRTGFGMDKLFFQTLVDLLRTSSLDNALRHPEVNRRVQVYRENDLACLETLRERSRLDGNVIVTDLRSVSPLPVGNRFLIYVVFPEGNVSVRVQWGPKKGSVAVTLGHSIFTRTCRTDIGRLCSDFGGGGHRGAGACVLDPVTADDSIAEIVRRLRE